MLLQEGLPVQEKLRILSDAAKYDAACTSSGVKRKGRSGAMGNTLESGICHSFAADGRCISLLKILFTNQCIYDCKYCINRCSNDVVRTSFTPQEVCELTMEFYRRNYIEGLFLSSGILGSADFTMEQICLTLRKLRTDHHFNGYIHVKAIPGASPELIEEAGFLADRMSVNLELPTAEGLRRLAPGKSRDKILLPMRQIQKGIISQQAQQLTRITGRAGLAGGASLLDPRYLSASAQIRTDGGSESDCLGGSLTGGVVEAGDARALQHLPSSLWNSRQFVPAGQSTQLIVGATLESDYQMMAVAQALYRNFGLKRVFYSAYIPVNQDNSLPAPLSGPPLLREHRLYQADWLLRYYGFQADELLSEQNPNFNILLDPKCDWALRHLEQFPVEVSRADYRTLLRVPGIGVKSARRILAARRCASLDFPALKKMGVVLKRAAYFITCSGRMMGRIRMDQDYITNCLVGEERRAAWDITHQDSYRQLSLFDDMSLEQPVSDEDRLSALTGAL